MICSLAKVIFGDNNQFDIFKVRHEFVLQYFSYFVYVRAQNDLQSNRLTFECDVLVVQN